MFRSFSPLPQANPNVDKTRAEEYLGHKLLTHKDSYYFLGAQHQRGKDKLCSFTQQAVEAAAEACSAGHSIYLCCPFGEEVIWIDPEELVDTMKAEDGKYLIGLSDFQQLSPWEEDMLNRRIQGKPAARAGTKKDLTDTILEFVKSNPGVTNIKIAEALGKLPHETSGLVASLNRAGQLRREKETVASGDRVAYQYFPN